MNDLGLFVSINLIANLKAQLKCLFFLPSWEEIAADLLYDSHYFQLTIQISYYFLQPMSNQSILKEISPGISLEGMMLKLKLQYLWPPHAKSWLIRKDSDAGRDWRQEKKRTTEDEMAGWHHWLDGHESEWTLGVGDGQGGLACCDSWSHKESDMTAWLNWTKQMSYNKAVLKN